MTHHDHLDPGLMASYLENACLDDDRILVETHLAECLDCCRELVALNETIRTLSDRRKGRFLIPLIAFGAAAALAGLIVFRSSDLSEVPRQEVPIIQRSEPEVRNTIVVRGPESGANLAAGEAILRWAPMESGARYLVTVTTSEGDSIWAQMTPDTAITIPVALDPGGEYLWYVDALLPGGRTASSGVHHFRISP